MRPRLFFPFNEKTVKYFPRFRRAFLKTLRRLTEEDLSAMDLAGYKWFKVKELEVVAQEKQPKVDEIVRNITENEVNIVDLSDGILLKKECEAFIGFFMYEIGKIKRLSSVGVLDALFTDSALERRREYEAIYKKFVREIYGEEEVEVEKTEVEEIKETIEKKTELNEETGKDKKEIRKEKETNTETTDLDELSRLFES